MKYRTIVLVTALSATAGAFAAEAVRQATLTWTKPTEYVDGTAIPSGTPATYNVYQGAKGSTNKLRVAEGVSQLSRVVSALPPGETCFNVTAVVNGQESAYSVEGCKSFPFPAPTAPTLVVD